MSTTFSHQLLPVRTDASVLFVADGKDVTGTELTTRLSRRIDELDLRDRSLVLLSGDNSLEYVVTYLALLEAGHVPLLAGGHVSKLTAAWSPSATVHVAGQDVAVTRHDVALTELHPDLALLLSTSGSTGSPKLVRLSHENLVSNAVAIRTYLGLTEADRGITSLPLHYCYGLSVLHSHLVAGASVVLTDASVVDPCFHRSLRDSGVTNVAGVPHTYEMLERAGPDLLRVPSLRFLTQAGGRLDREAVVRWSKRAQRWGADFYVMYGQTEATARMAYLPPDLAVRWPSAMGVPVPGGQFDLRPAPDLPDGVGELVYRGPNVMMGYASVRDDLALGRTIDELPTGDLARFHAGPGLFEIVGRLSRFVKPFGIRVDLDAVERHLRSSDLPAGDPPEVAVTGDDHRIVVAAPGADASAVACEVGRWTGLPTSSVVVHVDGLIHRTPSGKVDYDELRRRSHPVVHGRPRESTAECSRTAELAGVYSSTLGCTSVDSNQSFVSLGGDSLHYVECSLRLERVLGHVPPDWHLRTIADLADSAVTPRRLSRIDTTVLLRALGICVIVGTHMRVFRVLGGSHLLLAVVGYNLARFMMPVELSLDRVRAGLRTAARAAIPTIIWVGGGMLLVGAYSVGTLLLVNNYVGPASHEGNVWDFWFIEVFVHLVVITTLLMAIPPVRTIERRFPWAFALVLFLVILVLRLEWAHLGDWYNLRFRTHGVAWIFVLGWLVQRSGRWWQRLVTSGLCVVFVQSFFHDPRREWFIMISLLVLLWCRELPFPRRLARPVGLLAAASMWIYVSHFTFWPLLVDVMNLELAYVVTIAAGVVIWAVVTRAMALVTQPTRRVVAEVWAWRPRRHRVRVCDDSGWRAKFGRRPRILRAAISSSRSTS